MEISEFLAARLDEREAGADDFHDARRCGSLDRDGGFELARCDCGHPARELREVEAGRKILAEYQRIEKSVQAYPNGPNAAALITMQATLRTVATVDSDHPDYQREWGL
jgi:hypothetical protein